MPDSALGTGDTAVTKTKTCPMELTFCWGRQVTVCQQIMSAMEKRGHGEGVQGLREVMYHLTLGIPSEKCVITF